MNPTRLIRLTVAPLVLALTGTALADEVVLVAGATVKGAVGGRVRGQIQSESAAEVVVKLGQNMISVPTDQVVSVRYDGQPASMALAESREAGGQLAEAADLYKRAAGEAAAKPLIQQTARFKQAEVTASIALADPGRSAEAIGLLDAFVKAMPDSRLTAPALETLARLSLQKGDFARVDRAVADLARLPRGADRAAVLKARVASRRGDNAAAVAELDRLIKAAPDGSGLKREARLARAESLAGLKKFPEAEAEVRAVILASPAEDVAAQSVAYNTLGDCLRAAGRPKDALFAYLHTDLVYGKDKEQHPRALAQISRLWRELKREDRADEAWQRLKQEYPQSPWLKPSPATP
jgi:tetratricopeptide (TPR) repeat protein